MRKKKKRTKHMRRSDSDNENEEKGRSHDDDQRAIMKTRENGEVEEEMKRANRAVLNCMLVIHC